MTNQVTDIILVPGIGNSGEAHWQSRWQERNASMRRMRCSDWDRPDLGEWIAALDREVAASKEPPWLVAHSLGCLLVAHWASTAVARVAGAFLVAVPDPSSPVFPSEAHSFAQVPAARLPFPSLIVASTDDPYASIDYASMRAAQWGSRVAVAGALGHINGASAIADWPQGKELWRAFAAELARGQGGKDLGHFVE
ncbi:alpha/beta fold hydrolase [Pendulispora brunnea]|uniref:Alpha/beta fold hydrolase n=1 Tax=Pendulispora brunnea TaxID=2905690 RepID=A0ABZ2K8D3_9BACT